MLIRIVRMSFKEEAVEEFQEIFWSSREKILAMPGCHHVELLRDANDATVFTTYSKWESEEHLNNYRKSETFGGVWPRTKALFREKAEANSYWEE